MLSWRYGSRISYFSPNQINVILSILLMESEVTIQMMYVISTNEVIIN